MKKPYDNVASMFTQFSALYGESTVEQQNRYSDLFTWFKDSFSENQAYFVSSSGRVEVCGNHTDHNGGKVVSCAISLDTLAAFLPTNDGVVYIKSQGYDDIKVDLSAQPTEKIGTSAALVRGVCVALKSKGYNVGGFKACMVSNVFGGAGISSSASFEVLVAEVLNFLYNDGKITEEEKAKFAQFSEREYFGKPCGLLDQTAIAFGGLKLLDFSNKEKISVTAIDNTLSEYTLVLINTGGSHADLTNEYAAIPAEMREVAALFGKERLVDVGKDEFYNRLPQIYGLVSDRAILRTIHFFDENQRVDTLKDALDNADYAKFLGCVNESGRSSLINLQNCCVAGSKDQAIPKAIAVSSKYLGEGACRVHGGGFAGSILCIVKNDQLESFLNNMRKYYQESFVLPLKVRSVGTIVL